MKKIACIAFFLLSFICFANAQDIQEIIAEGTGLNERSAVEDAFKNAIEQSIGVYVDSETMVENDKLINDNILIASKGYIEKYMLLSVENQKGLTTVKIKAIVKMQAVREKLTSLNIATITPQDSKNAFARLTTKTERRESAEKILLKEFEELFSTESILELLDIKLVSYKIHENKVTRDNMVPLEISFTMSINTHNYNKKMEALAQVFTNLGATVSKRLNIWIDNSFGAKISDEGHYYTKKISWSDERYSPYFGLVTVKDNYYVLTHYRFPVEWDNIFPWISKPWNDRQIRPNGSIGHRISIALMLKSDHSVLLEEELSAWDFHRSNSSFTEVLECKWEGEYLDTSLTSPNSYMLNGCSRSSSCNICPFLKRSIYLFPIISFTYKTNINFDLLYDLHSIELKLQRKE